MKKILLLNILFFIGLNLAYSQITIGTNHFPSVGDEMRIARDTNPYIFMTGPGPAQNWDFSALNVTQAWVREIKAASTGVKADSFPNADFIIPWLGGEGYADVQGDSIEMVGYFANPLPVAPNLDVFARYNPTPTLYRANLDYGDTFTENTFYQVELDGATIPPEEVPYGISADSARYVFSSINVDTVDAYGTMTTPMGTWDVLRVKHIEYRDVQLWGKFPFFGWIDASGYGIDGVGQDTLVTYSFFSDTSLEPIAFVEIRSNGSNRYVDFKIDNSINVSTNEIANRSKSIKVYPNPAVNQVSFEIDDFEAGEYDINIYNIIGRQVKNQSVQIGGQKETITEDISDLNKGSYMYSILNNKGEILATKRLVIIRP